MIRLFPRGFSTGRLRVDFLNANLGHRKDNAVDGQKISTKKSIETSAGTNWTAIGTDFEIRCQDLLQSEELGFQLEKIGGKNDQGVDLKGHWGIVGASVVVQCKHNQIRKFPVSFVREFEGSLNRQQKGIIGVLLSTTLMTKAALKVFQTSAFPMMFGVTSTSNRNDRLSFRNVMFNDKFTEVYPDISLTTEYVRVDGRVVEKIRVNHR